jgi:hypothetical protein
MRPEDDGLDGKSIFEPQPRGTPFEHSIVQAMQIVGRAQREGGFFVMIGRKPKPSAVTARVAAARARS